MLINLVLIKKIVRYSLLGLIGLCLALSLGIDRSHAISLKTPQESPALIASSNATSSNSSLDRGRNLYDAGQFAEAVQVWQMTAQSYGSQGDRPNQALTLSYLSLAYQQLNQWNAAQNSIDESLAILNGVKPVDAILWAQILNTKAILQQQIGQSQTAVDTWKQAQGYYQQAGDVQGVLGTEINQAQALQSLGFYRRSRQILDDINQQLEKSDDSLLKVSGLRSVGNALRVLGDNEASYKSLSWGLAIAKNLNALNELSPILIGLGNNAADTRNFDVALQHFIEAEKAATKASDRIESKLNQLQVYVNMGQTQAIATLAPNILQELSEIPPSRASLYAIVNFASNLSKLPPQDQPIPSSTIIQLLDKSVQSARKVNDAQAEAYLLSQWGQLVANNGQPNEGIRLLQQSMQLSQSIQSKNILSQSAWKLGRLLHQQGQKQAAIAAYGEAVDALQNLRSDLVGINQEVQFSFRESIEPVYREFVSLLIDENPDQSALVKARELIEALQLAELDNFFRESCLNSQPLQIDQIDTKAAVVYAIMLPNRIAVILSTAGQPLTYYSSPVPKEEAEQTIRSYLGSIHPASDNKSQKLLSQKIYNWLIRPAVSSQALKEKQTLVFVLDGLLRKIPMAALYDGKQYLIENYAVALSPGLKLLETQSLEQKQIRSVVAGISTARNGFNALPAVETEVVAISQSTSGSKLLNQEFTPNALSKSIESKTANVVHLATHGQFSSKQEDTFLLTWDGRLNIRELSELLQKRETGQSGAIDLLVLSACDTAAGDDRAVLGLAGLALKSGARSTIATLWPVKDNVASRLMVKLYQDLGKPHVSKAEALRQAQISILSDKNFTDPFFWSSFVLVGNWL
ncbi:CHAT domain-containing protein [Pseudanabaena sp. UWO310]|uniref:CHAT domain-containing protein n=1 Tax=Pseudanabaena sp. UWO310 TaxID=2480795 RepID=UPI0011585517|nr:CHAT domain-containing protein [Pseudanabaena sp. UWO310]TYQ31331.1 CHAT domain-containing protein [Pseudanabaena sp. UWO310]